MSTGVGIFCLIWVRKPAGDDWGAFGNGYKGAQSALEVTSVLSSASATLVQDSTEDTCRYIKTEFVTSRHKKYFQAEVRYAIGNKD